MFSHSYRFLNRPATIRDEASGKVDWEYAGEGGLWLDNLHYMRYWDGLGAQLSIEDEANLLRWLKDWVEHLVGTPNSKALNPPYNASERAYSLGRFLLTREALANTELDSLIKLIIARDLNFVASRLEFHLGGNHLLKNLMALAWGTCLFEGEDAKRWQRILDRELHGELDRQILSDGLHYERSPMYHNIALHDLLDVINLARDGPVRDSLVSLARAMTAATKLVTHADGEIAFFNDCALDSCPRSEGIIEYSEVLCGGIDTPQALPVAGIYSLEAGDAMKIVTKFGPLGPGEQMGHAHADLFSFELSVNDRMVFVNSGTSTYYDQPFRDNERAGGAHNTVVVPGYVQCHHWSYFRVASRTQPTNVSFESSAEQGATLSGMVELLGNAPRPILMRKIKANLSGSFVITDAVAASYPSACSIFHLHPDVSIISIDDERRSVVLGNSDGQMISFEYSSGSLAIEDCLISRRFNERQPSRKLVISDWNVLATPSLLEVKIQVLLENINRESA
jgi:uncharacterized heparinase superfamily protein